MPRGIYPSNRLPKGKKQYPESLVESVRTLYLVQNFSQDEIAALLRISRKVVYTVMQNHGIAARRCGKRYQHGSANSSWKGDAAGYDAMHLRVAKERGTPRQCDMCGQDDPSLFYDWANLTGNYADTSDYKRMCRACHRLYDNARTKKGVA